MDVPKFFDFVCRLEMTNKRGIVLHAPVVDSSRRPSKVTDVLDKLFVVKILVFLLFHYERLFFFIGVED